MFALFDPLYSVRRAALVPLASFGTSIGRAQSHRRSGKHMARQAWRYRSVPDGTTVHDGPAWHDRTVAESRRRRIAPRELSRRSRVLDVTSYAVELDLSTGDDAFWSRTEVRFRCNQDGFETWADLDATGLYKLKLNDRDFNRNHASAGRLRLPSLRAENTLLVEAEFAYRIADEGLNSLAQLDGRQLGVYSKTNQGGARRVFCCFDQPDLRAPFSVVVRAPPDWVCLTNAPRLTGQPHLVGLWSFEITEPLAPYQFSVCAGLFLQTRVPMHGSVESPT
jgi:aminopeptidase N